MCLAATNFDFCIAFPSSSRFGHHAVRSMLTRTASMGFSLAAILVCDLCVFLILSWLGSSIVNP